MKNQFPHRPFPAKLLLPAALSCLLTSCVPAVQDMEHVSSKESNQSESTLPSEAVSGTISETDSTQNPTSVSETTNTASPAPNTPPSEPGGGRILTDEARKWCVSYFKAGDCSYTAQITPGERLSRNTLILEFYKQESEASAKTIVFRLPFSYDGQQGQEPYNIRDEKPYPEDGASPVLSFCLNQDGSLTLFGDSQAAGTYYPSEENLLVAAAFERPLNSADLAGFSKEELKILRNQFYAAHGRVFETADMKAAFEAKPWYIPRIPADSFDEAVFNPIEKRNIHFLLAAETAFKPEQSYSDKKALEKLEPVPYLDLLPEHMEISMEIASDAEHSSDKGIYYEAQGTISLPVTITPEQYEEVMEKGGTAQIEINGLTGETAVLSITDNPDYGDCLLFFEDDPYFDGHFYISYEPYSGLYTLWQNSADTLFKPVYQGPVYVLKGAEEEWYGYFPLEHNRDDPDAQSAGAWRVMTFDEASPYGPSPYMGNVPVFNEKGYLKALYYYGD